MEPLECWTPRLQYTLQSAIRDVWCSQLLGNVAQSQPIKAAVEYMHDAVEDQLAITLHRENLAILLKLPSVNGA